MDDYHLEEFAAVAEELNFRRAADRLHLSPSPLSRHIRELEAELGVLLFERDTRHVRLTPAGEALLPLALDVLAGMANAARTVSRAAGQRPELVVGMRALSVRFHRLLADTMAPAAPCTLRMLPVETTVQRLRHSPLPSSRRLRLRLIPVDPAGAELRCRILRSAYAVLRHRSWLVGHG